MELDERRLHRNIELKARCPNIERARNTALELGARDSGTEYQKDTYFQVAKGRLKLREIQGQSAALIWYDRSDSPDARPSRYMLIPVSDSQSLITALSLAVGVHRVIEKERRIFIYRNVRLHFDKVAGLGDFLEFEAVLSPGESGAGAYELLEQLRHRFAISDNDLISSSYEALVPLARDQ